MAEEREPTQIEMMDTAELIFEALALAGAVAIGADHTPLEEMTKELAGRIEGTRPPGNREFWDTLSAVIEGVAQEEIDAWKRCGKERSSVAAERIAARVLVEVRYGIDARKESETDGE